MHSLAGSYADAVSGASSSGADAGKTVPFDIDGIVKVVIAQGGKSETHQGRIMKFEPEKDKFSV